MPGTRKLGRATSHRTAMLRAMVTFLLENGKIETTVTRAKEVRSLAEKMITIAKTNDLHSKRLVMGFVTKEAVTNKLFTEIAPKYADRNGGYTRITKLGPRRGDAAEMAIFELIYSIHNHKRMGLCTWCRALFLCEETPFWFRNRGRNFWHSLSKYCHLKLHKCNRLYACQSCAGGV